MGAAKSFAGAYRRERGFILPNAEYTVFGMGARAANRDAHFVVSVSITALSFGEDSVLGARREMVDTVSQASISSSVLRI